MIDIYRRWVSRAACSGQSTRLFFPENEVLGGRETPKKQDTTAAKAVCRTCPVMAQCRRDHLGERYGVWGGLDAEQRRLMRTKRSAGVSDLSREEKTWLAKFIVRSRNKGMAPTDLQRLLALNTSALEYLESWWEKQRNPEAVLHLPEAHARQPGVQVTDQERRKILNLARLGTLTQKEIAQRVRRTPNTVGQVIKKSKENHAPKGESTSSVRPGQGAADQADHPSQLLDAG